MLMTPRAPRHIVLRPQPSGNRNRPPPPLRLFDSPLTRIATSTPVTDRAVIFASPEQSPVIAVSPAPQPVTSEHSQHDSTISIGDSTSPSIISLSPPRPATAPPDRPLATSPPARPASALPAFPMSMHRRPQHQHHREIRPLTLAKTPRCARPTKAWIARFQSAIEPSQEERPPQKKCSKEVWERLTGVKSVPAAAGVP